MSFSTKEVWRGLPFPYIRVLKCANMPKAGISIAESHREYQ